MEMERGVSGLVKRSFSLAGHRTSVALESEFWDVLLRMAQARGQSLSALVAAADAVRGPDRPLASALRVLALTGERIASRGDVRPAE
jgi:predicted DNA-binding ribbon-helix-helix protein